MFVPWGLETPAAFTWERDMSEQFDEFDYPKWKYHASKKPTLVNSKHEEMMLGPEWENSPAYFSGQTLETKSNPTKIDENKVIKKIKGMFKWPQQGI
jgi:hypothetical protein